MDWRTPADDNGLQRPFADSTRQLSTARRRLRPGYIGRTVEVRASRKPLPRVRASAQGTGSITHIAPARNHLPGIQFGLRPPSNLPVQSLHRAYARHWHKRLLRAAESAALNSCQLWHIRHEETRKEVSP
jgi:hypothetical protein